MNPVLYDSKQGMRGGEKDLKVDTVCNHQVVEKCMTYEELRRSAGRGDD